MRQRRRVRLGLAALAVLGAAGVCVVHQPGVVNMAARHWTLGGKGVDECVAMLQDPDQNVRMEAIDRLGAKGSDAVDALPALLEVARHDNIRVRSWAIREGLAKMGRPAVPALRELTHDAAVRTNVVASLREIGPDAADAVPELCDVLWAENSSFTRLLVCETLARIGPDARESVPALVAALFEPGSAIRPSAAAALGVIDPEALRRARAQKRPATERIAYGKAPEQYGLLRLPAGPGPYPVVVVIHGGFWRAEYGLDYLDPLCEAMTERGLATWNVEYRRLGQPGGGWPGTFQDVGRAVDHLREMETERRLDLGRVVVIGHSAGGHLALWAAGRKAIPADSPLHTPAPLPVRAAASLAGVTDLHWASANGVGGDAVARLLGGTPAQVPTHYAAGSPAELVPLGVPTVLVHGTEDRSVPLGLSERYAQRALAKGDRVLLVRLARLGHFEMTDPKHAQGQRVVEGVISLIGRSHGPAEGKRLAVAR